MQGVSGRALARLLNVSEGAVRKARDSGHITALPDGSFDPDACRAAWAQNTDPARTKVRTSVRTSTQVRTPDDARAAVSLILRVLQEEGGGEPRALDYEAIRSAETILKARERDLRMQVTSGKLVDAAEVERRIFDLARQERDALVNWPSQAAPLIAAELGTDPVRLALALEQHVRTFLAERAEPSLRIKT